MNNNSQLKWIVKLELDSEDRQLLKDHKFHWDTAYSCDARVIDVGSNSRLTPLHWWDIEKNQVIAYMRESDYWIAKPMNDVTAVFHRTYVEIK